MPKGVKVRYVKFTPEEMAYEAPEDVSDPKRFPAISRGRQEWEQFLCFRRGYVRLDEELRKQFKSDDEIREALQQYVQIRDMVVSNRTRRKSA